MKNIEHAHAIGRVYASAFVRERIQAAAQRSEQGLEQTHIKHESDFRVLANLFFQCIAKSPPTGGTPDSPILPQSRPNRS